MKFDDVKRIEVEALKRTGQSDLLRSATYCGDY